mmetsp:Transcript_21133/g.47609  ORF Transcript_21133/g.47609 Transcript_21133/m.47609 type:complete len:209 (-) Transcript_21133:232-858(-)
MATGRRTVSPRTSRTLPWTISTSDSLRDPARGRPGRRPGVVSPALGRWGRSSARRNTPPEDWYRASQSCSKTSRRGWRRRSSWAVPTALAAASSSGRVSTVSTQSNVLSARPSASSSSRAASHSSDRAASSLASRHLGPAEEGRVGARGGYRRSGLRAEEAEVGRVEGRVEAGDALLRRDRIRWRGCAACGAASCCAHPVASASFSWV